MNACMNDQLQQVNETVTVLSVKTEAAGQRTNTVDESIMCSGPQEASIHLDTHTGLRAGVWG